MLFPEQLGGVDVDALKEEHIPVEPQMGLWCFEQFAAEFVALQKSEAADLYVEHKDLEPWLNLWGEQALWTREGVEPYVGGWCKAQWPEAFGDLDPVSKFEFYAQENGGHVPVESFHGRDVSVSVRGGRDHR